SPSTLARRCAAIRTADAELLLVGSIRRWLRDAEEWPAVVDEFIVAFGGRDPTFALNGLKCLLESLSGAARRTRQFHRPGCSRLSADEATLVALIATLQKDRQAHAEAILRWLLPRPAQGGALRHAFWIAHGMSEAGLRLRLPRIEASGAPEIGR